MRARVRRGLFEEEKWARLTPGQGDAALRGEEIHQAFLEHVSVPD